MLTDYASVTRNVLLPEVMFFPRVTCYRGPLGVMATRSAGVDTPAV
jgi:hypothetical protein